MKRPYLKHTERRERLLLAALQLAATHGYQKVTRLAVATQCHCAVGLVSRHFFNVQQMRRLIMEEAVRTGDLCVVAQGLAAHDRTALAAPLELRQRAAASIAGE